MPTTKQNLIKLIVLQLLVIFLALLTNCALMPRTVLNSDSGDIIESQVTTGKYKIYIYPLDNSAVLANDKNRYSYTVGAYDQISIVVWGHPEFSSPSGITAINGTRYPTSGTFDSQINQGLNVAKLADKAYYYSSDNNVAYTIDEDGAIHLPLCGKITVINKTPKQIRQDVAKKLLDYVVNPQVSVRVTAYRSKFTYILGEINQANTIALNDVPLNLDLALSMSGWVNLSSADVKNIYVLRQGANNNIYVYRLDATSPTALIVAGKFVLQPSDVVFVSTAGVAQFDRVASKFVNAAETFWYTTTAINPTGTIFPGLQP